jgi:hypothetical protein
MTLKSDRYFGLFAKPEEYMKCAPGIDAVTKYFGNYECNAVFDHEILFAAYEQAEYDGHSVVLFERNNILYLVEASHCSCYGLEGLFKPEEVDWGMVITLNSNSFCWSFDPDANSALYNLISQHVN